jgi:hypothetical protein
MTLWMMVGLLIFFVGMILNYVYGLWQRESGLEQRESGLWQRGSGLWQRGSGKEGFLEKNTQLNYFPQKASGGSDSHISFGVNDFTREAIEVPVCIKTYKELMKPLGEKDPPRTSPTQEYTKALTGLDIYKKYTHDIAGKMTEIMDKQYGELFSSSVLSSKSQAEFLTLVEKRMTTANRLHNFIKFF